MKRLLVIVAFVVVVIGALGGGAYLFTRGETSTPRKPVVAKEAELEPETVRDNSGGPLGATDPVDPARDDDASDTGGIGDDGEPVKPDKTPVKPDRTPVKPDRTDPRRTPEGDVTTPDNPDTPTQPEIVPTEGLVTLAGRVTDDLGDPVPGAGVMLKYNVPVTRESSGRTPAKESTSSFAATDNDGFYRTSVKLIFPSPEGELSVDMWAQAGNGLRSDSNLTPTVKLGSTYENLDFVVPRGGELIGQVLNQRFEALAGATVFAQFANADGKDKPFRTTTDANGAFSFSGLKPGSYQVFATAEGYQPDGDIQVIEVPSGQTTNMNDAVKMKPNTALRVRLTATESQPSGAVAVTFYNADGKSTKVAAKADGQGNALISGVPEDAVEMVIQMRGYQATERIAVSVIKDDHNDLGEISLLPETDDER